jgi:hypothetical protein
VENFPSAKAAVTELPSLQTSFLIKSAKGRTEMKVALVGLLFAITPSVLGMAWLLWHYAADRE